MITANLPDMNTTTTAAPATRPALRFTGIALEYWRRESWLGCAVSLDRLRSICAARGADFAATVRGLDETMKKER